MKSQYEFLKFHFINGEYNFFCPSTFHFPVYYTVLIMDSHFQPDLLLSPPTALSSAHGARMIKVYLMWMTVVFCRIILLIIGITVVADITLIFELTFYRLLVNQNIYYRISILSPGIYHQYYIF